MKAAILLAVLAACSLASPSTQDPRSSSGFHRARSIDKRLDRHEEQVANTPPEKIPKGPMLNPYQNFVDAADVHAVLGE